ncbi:cation:proton antiporter [Kiritimatiellaeota bacterium B1221]|nr:cation:proton antiporter [Kiritimatiellaeota bacterium B1221]
MLPITDHVLIFTIIISMILLAPLLGALLRIPDMVLLLIAGAALGADGFGILERNEAITLFGEIGLLYIMFLAGLEIDLYEFSRTKFKSISFGFVTFLIPQVLGAVVVYYALGDWGWSAAILMASMFASHTLLAYPVAAKLGIHRSQPVTISVGATIVTDTLALLVLAVIVDASQDIVLNARFWGSLVLALMVLVFAIVLIIPRLARWFFKHVSESGGTQFLFVLTVVCACAYFSQYARMKPLIGAFLAGAALNRQIPEHSALMNRLEFVGNNLFIPFFLISVGMLVDPAVLVADPETWKVIGVMVGMVVVTKFLAAWIAGMVFGYKAHERNVMFGLTVVQAAATLAAALVGFDAGLLNDAALNGAIAMIMVTVPLGSWVVQRSGRKMALADVGTSRVLRLEQRLLIAVHKPEMAVPLMELGLLCRDKATPGGLYPFTIVSDQHDTEVAVAGGEKLLAQCINRASAASMEVEPQLRVDINPVDGIVRGVRELRATTVISGWNERPTPGSRIFGTTQQNLTEVCPSRVMLCRLLKPLATNKILRVPMPPLSEYRNDLNTLIRESKHLAKQAGVKIHLYLSGPSAEKLEEAFENMQPGCETKVTLCKTWKECRQKLFADIGGDDLVLLPQIRRDTALWTPTLDPLPELMARQFPDNNLIVVYPEIESQEDFQGPVALPADDTFPEIRGIDLDAGQLAESRIEQLVKDSLPEDPEMVAEAIPALIDSAKLTPVALAKDVILLHGHCGNRAGPIILVGMGDPIHPFFDQEESPRILISLLSPKDDSPEIHLRSLARVAKRFRQPGIRDQLEGAGHAADVCRILADAGGE